MFWSWWKQQNGDNLIGLDISSDFVKLMKINSTTKPYLVDSFLISALPAGAIEKDEIKDPGTIAEVLKGMHRDAELTTKEVAFGISRTAVVTKNFKVSNRLTSHEIESRAWIEAQRYFPDLVGLIYLDFEMVGPSTEDPNQMDVMLMACRKEHINPYLEIAKLAGLKAKIVEVNSYALERALSLIENIPKTCALLNLDLTLSSLIIFQDKKMIFAHDQSFDGHRIKTQIQERIDSTTATWPRVVSNVPSCPLRKSAKSFAFAYFN